MDIEDFKNRTGLAIMVGLIFLGLMIPKAVKDFRSFDRTVSVKGLCEREVQADKAIWPIKFKAAGNDLNAVNAEVGKKCSIVCDFLAQGGFSADEFSVSAPVISDKYAQEYGSNDRMYRYVETVTVTLCTDKVTEVLALMARLNELSVYGIASENEWDGGAQFYFEALNDLKPEMIREATRNARQVAQEFAEDSGSSLGKIKTANQGTFSIENRDSSTPFIKKVRVVTSVEYYLKK